MNKKNQNPESIPKNGLHVKTNKFQVEETVCVWGLTGFNEKQFVSKDIEKTTKLNSEKPFKDYYY